MPDVIEPSFFLASSTRLFAAHHLPRIVSGPPSAVVCCYPLGQEYLRAHRAFHQLGERLAARGFHVLRFDYYGLGDSEGGSDEGGITRWTRDVEAAIEHLKGRASVGRVSLLGLRLGATLALLAASRRVDVEQLVLWEPVLDGRTYLEELRRAHDRLIEERQLPRCNGRELLGFPMPPEMAKTIEGITEPLPAIRQGMRALLLEQVLSLSSDALARRLRRLDVRVDHEQIRESPVWERREMSQAVVPRRTLDRMVSWLIEARR